MPVVAVGAGEILLSLCAVLLLFCFGIIVYYVVVTPLRAYGIGAGSILGQIPIIGGVVGGAVAATASKLADGIEAATSYATGVAEAWAEKSIQAAVDLVYVGAGLARQLWEAQVGLMEDTLGFYQHVLTVTIPGAIQSALSQAGVLAQDAQDAAARYTDWVWSQIATRVDGVEAAAADAITGLRQDVITVVTETTNVLEGQLGDLERLLEGELSGAVGELRTVIGNELARAVDAENGIEARARAAVDGATAAAREALGDAVRDVEGKLSVGDLATAAAAAAATAVVAAELAKIIKDCVTPQCDALGGLTKLLPGLQQLLAGGALLALVAEAIHDPEGTAKTVEATVTGPLDTARDLVGALAGVR